jgi:hypothetical protein
MFSRSSVSRRAILPLLLVLWVIPSTWAQHGSEGTVTVTVLDATGSVVQGAQLELVDTATNEVRKAETQSSGTHTFVNLSLGKYKLKVSKTGFQSQVFTDVIAEAAQTTDISSTLRVGAISETVEVTGGTAPLVETTTNAIGTTIDMKQIEDLPIQGRDLTQLANLVPGYTGTGQNGGGSIGTWNGLPSAAAGSNIDGVIGSAGRMKFGGSVEPSVEPRVEDIQEMTVQTDQLDLNQGFGTSNLQLNFVTRRGTNAFHGRVFDDFRNTVLDANSWLNNAQNPKLPRNTIILNDFGGSLGGPILKDKLFFFGTYAESKQPGHLSAAAWILPQTVQAGNFTYTDSNGNLQTINVLHLAANSGQPSTLNSQTASTLSAVNGVLSQGSISATGDPNLDQLNWQVSAPTTIYFPTVRVDYILSQKMRFNVAWNETKTIESNFNQPNLPGSAFANTGSSDKFQAYTAAFGFDWTLSPTMVNEFRGGFLYNGLFFAYDGKGPTGAQISWNLPNLPYTYNTAMNGTNYQIPTGSYYPSFNASDTFSWQRGAHTLNFGFSWWREQDHYYNGVLGFPVINLGQNTSTSQPGLANGDPAQAAFNGTLPNATPTAINEAESLYAILTGRINSVNGQFPYDPSTNQYNHAVGAYNLDELQKAFGVFFQDSYRLKPNFTLNYGLRWDFTAADRDLTNLYHSASPANIFGPTGINDLFAPGSLTGVANPQLTQNSQPYNSWNVAPQPAIGIAWSPHSLGGDKTVIRAGYSLRKFTEPQQYVWNQASDFGQFYYQNFGLSPGSPSPNTPGIFSAGSLSLGNALPAYALSPQSYQKTEAESDFTFVPSSPGVNGIDPNLRQPYTQSWNLGIQHQLGATSALELRYVGNRTLRQWLAIDTNEVNIFQPGPNGVLTNFKTAQANLAANNASGNPNYQGSFANHHLAGQGATPLFDAAFSGESAGADGSLADYTNGGFVGDLNSGSAGALAQTLAGISGPVSYFCNLVGASFLPCTQNVAAGSFNPAGAGLPINFLQANPYTGGNNTGELVAEGYSNYNGVQVDFRQRSWHGVQFDANYTWSHTLGISTPNNWQGQSNIFTLRDMRLSYGPSLFDIRHAVNINGSYDLPFGRGKQFGNQGGALDRIIGGWTIGSIFVFQTGVPFLLQGGNSTFNANPINDGFGDGGVVLNGVTPSQLQNAVGVYRVPGQPFVDFINPKYLASPIGGGANQAYITANTTPGTIGQLVYLHGPHFINDDLAITKIVPITEKVRFKLQAEMLNAFNHPNFQTGSANGSWYNGYANGFTPNVQNSQFGIGGISQNYPSGSPNQGARVIELRANVEF